MDDKLSFSEALDYIKDGRRVARRGWNGSTFKVNRAPLLGIYAEWTGINYQAHIDMRTADGSIVPWLGSITDVLAEDWCRA